MDGALFASMVPLQRGPGIFAFLTLEDFAQCELNGPTCLPYQVRQACLDELKAKVAEEMIESSPQRPVDTKPQRVKILLADDHETVRTGVRVILKARTEYEIIEVSNGADALIEVQRANFDLVILDLTMPGLDGFTVAQEIRKHLPQLPILFFSMHQLSPALLSLARSRQVQGFVCKSESGAVLLTAVDALLAKKDFFPSEA